MFIVDAHLDLAYNQLNDGRHLRQELDALRATEVHDPARGRATVTFPELLKGGVGLVFGSLFVFPAASPLASSAGRITYTNSEQAHRHASAQLDYYHRLNDEEQLIKLVGDTKSLEQVLASHKAGGTAQLGIVPMMEGADPIRHPEEVQEWYDRGLRVIGLAWDDTRYAAGAWRGGEAGLTKDGFQLLEMMAELSFILDLTHMSEKATYEAMDFYEGAIAATHSNARSLVPGERQLSDKQIQRIGERDGVIGIVLYNQFLHPEYRRGDPKELVTLDHVAAHIDHICQVLGSANHVGIGSDFDGGFGSAEIPAEMDSAADLSLIADHLLEHGYHEADVANIMSGNWLRLLRAALS